MTDDIDRYLDRLFDALAGTGSAGRGTLAEAEDHLRSAQADLVAVGVPPDVAAAQAVARFGGAEALAAAERVVIRDLPGLVRHVVSGAWVFGVVGLLAVGVSGLLAELMGRLWGAAFVAGDTNGVTYTPGRCAEYLEYFPGRSCGAAAALHHWGEVVDYRVAAGVLGLLTLLVGRLVQQRLHMALPTGPLMLVFASTFGLAAVALGGPSALELAAGGTTGVGADLSAGLVAGVVAVVALMAAMRTRSRLVHSRAT
jgi:hypothetical protein